MLSWTCLGSARTPRIARCCRSVLLATALLLLAPVTGTKVRSEPGPAEEPALVIANGGNEQRFTLGQLLHRPDAVTLNVTGDVYHHAVSYRAVPLLAILGDSKDPQFDTIEAKARDGFVSQLPLALIRRGTDGGAVAYLAIEDPAHPWPYLPQRTDTAGPFYLIWEHPERTGITREQWPYQLSRLTFVESPVHRWTQLAVPAAIAADDPARRGQEVFVVQCLPCHRLNGGGASDTGPDLGRPMNPTQYLTEAGLRAIIRNPKAVRIWPGQQMIGFSKVLIPDNDLDALIAYLRTTAMSSAR
jgi:mono/diheme cytochrome c family protein